MIYDISQGVFGCEVYPGDPSPEKFSLSSMEKGDLYNLSSFSMCTHNGTHVDAPLHFLPDGKSIDRITPDRFAGPCFVKTHEGDVTAEDAEKILEEAGRASSEARKRILIRGAATVTAGAAEVFAAGGVILVGNESQTVGPENAPMEVHRILLSAETVLLEGIRLSAVPDGAYCICCAPLKLEGAEGAPCRALLFDTI